MENNNKSLTFTLNKKTIALIIAGIAALLCLIGVFGTVMKSQTVIKIAGHSEKIDGDIWSLSYLFKDGWDALKEALDTPAALSAGRFVITLMMISFFVSVGGICFAIGKAIYSVYKKQEINFNLCLAILLICAAQYLFMSRFAAGYSGESGYGVEEGIRSTIKTNYFLGWGGILTTIGFFFGLAALFIYETDSKEALLNKTSICKKAAIIVAFFFGLYGLTNLVSFSVASEAEKVGYTFNSFTWLITLEETKELLTNYGAVKTLAVFGLIFGIISFLSFIAASFYYIKTANNEKDKKITLFATIGFVATSFISNIFLLISNNTFNDAHDYPGQKLSINVGFSFIVSLVLGAALIALVVVAYKKKKVQVQ